jgi:molybdate transport system substrate-binding protein
MRFVLCLLLTFCFSSPGRAQEIRLVAAGSLTDAFNVMIAEYGKRHPVHVTTTWGPSGVLRDSLERGAPLDIFASAALPHAQVLTDNAISGPSVLFVRNTLCAIVPAASTVTTGTLVEFLLKPETRLATSTPKADPGGDYTWRLFELIDHDHTGAYAALTGKAQQLFGGATMTTLVNGRHRLNLALDNGVADIGIYYRSWGHQAAAEAGKYRMMPLPADLTVGAEYGLTLSMRAPTEAVGFAMYILSPKGQKTLKDFGFVPVTLPQGD